MGDLSQLVGGGPIHDAEPPHDITCYAKVAKPPASTSDPLTVTLDAIGADHSFTVPAGHWAPRGSTLPTAGTRCLVVFDDRGDAWAPMWISDVAPEPQTFLSGTTVPDDATGPDGAIYLDLTSLELYGPKTAGAWGSPFARLLPLTPTWEDIRGS